jgi:hydrogenase maturation factor
MRVVRIDEASCVALCEDADGTRTDVATDLIGPLAEGDELLVHAGVALVRTEAAA